MAGGQESVLIFYFKHSFQPSLRCPAYCSLFSNPISSLRAPLNMLKPLIKPLRARSKATLDAPFKLFTSNNFPWEQSPWLAGQFLSPLQITYFHFRKPSRSGGRKPSRQLPGACPPKRRMRVGRSSQWGAGWQPSSSELWGWPVWMVVGPWRLVNCFPSQWNGTIN